MQGQAQGKQKQARFTFWRPCFNLPPKRHAVFANVPKSSFSFAQRSTSKPILP
jgi:hypothetical protein